VGKERSGHWVEVLIVAAPIDRDDGLALFDGILSRAKIGRRTTRGGTAIGVRLHVAG